MDKGQLKLGNLAKFSNMSYSILFLLLFVNPCSHTKNDIAQKMNVILAEYNCTSKKGYLSL